MHLVDRIQKGPLKIGRCVGADRVGEASRAQPQTAHHEQAGLVISGGFLGTAAVLIYSPRQLSISTQACRRLLFNSVSRICSCRKPSENSGYSGSLEGSSIDR